MEDLIFPIVVLAVLGAIVLAGVLITRAAGDPRDRWRSLAEKHGLEFQTKDNSLGAMELRGTVRGMPIKIASRYVGAGRFRQVISDLWLTLPDRIPREWKIQKAVSGFTAKQRGRSKDPHDPSLPLVWQVEGPDAAGARMEADPATRQRLTNLFVAYPHATIENGELHLDTVGTFGDQLDNTVELTTLLAEDLARIVS